MQPALNQYIDIRSNRRGQERAFVAGTRVRVQDIVLDHERHGQTAEQIAVEYPHLSLAQVHSALAYYFDHKEETWANIREDEAFAESMRSELTNSSANGQGKDENPDTLSS